MERKRQQYCAAAGAILLMLAGIVAIGGWRLASRSVAVQQFEYGLAMWPLIIGVMLFSLGICGLIAAWHWSRLALCSYAWAALVLSLFCAYASWYQLIQISSDATHFDRVCEAAQSGGSVGDSARVAAVQTGYNAMREALEWCRRYNPLALRLEACPHATDTHGSPWRDCPYVELLRWAETAYQCGGFCKDGIPLFALPEGTINEDNRDQTRTACFAPLTAEVRWHAYMVCTLLMTSAAVLIIPVCSACWLACAPPPLKRAGYVHRPEELEWTIVPQWVDDELPATRPAPDPVDHGFSNVTPPRYSMPSSEVGSDELEEYGAADRLLPQQGRGQGSAW